MRLALSLAFLGLLAAPVLADQPPNRFNGTPASIPLNQPLPVHFNWPGHNGETVTVEAFDSSNPDLKVKIQVDLKEGGSGVTNFTVPEGWDMIILQHPQSQDYSVWVGS